MVAAKLDQSRVLVTKFHQNRSTLKGRSAGQRQTHRERETNSAENKGPSGLQSGQKREQVRTIALIKIINKTVGPPAKLGPIIFL